MGCRGLTTELCGKSTTSCRLHPQRPQKRCFSSATTPTFSLCWLLRIFEKAHATSLPRRPRRDIRYERFDVTASITITTRVKLDRHQPLVPADGPFAHLEHIGDLPNGKEFLRFFLRILAHGCGLFHQPCTRVNTLWF